MSWVVVHMKAIMLVSGALTCTMISTVIAPEEAAARTFGETVSGPLAVLVVRNWAALIVLGGVMLIYGAFDPPSRPPILAMTAMGKAAFVALVLSHGGRYLSQPAVVAVVLDSVMVVLFIAYLARTRGR